MKTEEQLKEFIKSVIRHVFFETGPSAQGIIQPWLGPDLEDETGIQDPDDAASHPVRLKHLP